MMEPFILPSLLVRPTSGFTPLRLFIEKTCYLLRRHVSLSLITYTVLDQLAERCIFLVPLPPAFTL
jgi:hypothetical protein